MVDFTQKKLVFVDFGRKNWGLTRKLVLVDFGQKEVVFDRNNGFWSNSTEKTGFGRIWPKNVVMVDSGSFWVIWGHEFFELETEFSHFRI